MSFFISMHKAHVCMHMVLMSRHMNPRMVYGCLSGEIETFMGVMMLLGEACDKSCLGQGLPCTNLFMRRCVIGLHILMNNTNLLFWKSDGR